MLRQGGGGAIVNMASVTWLDRFSRRKQRIVPANKHRVIGLTKTAALENAKSGIRINAVCPGVIETAMGERHFGAPAVHKYVLSCQPLGRFGGSAEIAEAVVWMCSDRAFFMTGQSLVLDGGFLLSLSREDHCLGTYDLYHSLRFLEGRVFYVLAHHK
jgi:NAD(P)-dependent dehydrogenase (short-subunit alcohol dehydrogenase family)